MSFLPHNWARRLRRKHRPNSMTEPERSRRRARAARPNKARPAALFRPRRLPQAQIPRFLFTLKLKPLMNPPLSPPLTLRFPSILRMSDPIILSDDEDRIILDTPLPAASKKRRTGPVRGQDPPVLILDDDPTPKKFSCDSAPSFVAETPFSEVAIVKCTSRVHLPDDPLARASADCPPFSGQCFAHYVICKFQSLSRCVHYEFS